MRFRKAFLFLAAIALVASVTVCASAATEAVSGSIYKVNPLFQDSVVQPKLATSSSGTPSTYHTTEDAVVEQIRAGMENRETVIVVGYQGTADVDAMAENMYDNVMKHTGVSTQGDYLRWHCYSYGLDWETDSKTNKTVFTCTMTYLSTADQEDAVDEAVDTLLDTLNVYTASDYKKVEAIYDYICANVIYDTWGVIYGNQMVYTTYGALVNNQAVCQGYASLFYRLALELDVDTRVIAGVGAGENHGWNIVKLGDYYYNLDSTWDAKLLQSGCEYAYFLKSPDNFADHVRKDRYETAEFHQNYPMDFNNYVLPKNGWVYEQDHWYFYQDDVAATGWRLISGKWYYFETDGVMQTGWLKVGNVWYYLQSSGAMVTGWLKQGNTWYYLQLSGAMQTGWLKSGNTWYYLKSSGAMATGWQKVGSIWYYFQNGGAMKTGWLKLGNIWYYFRSSGAMATGSVKLGAKTYRFNSSGACLNP